MQSTFIDRSSSNLLNLLTSQLLLEIAAAKRVEDSGKV